MQQDLSVQSPYVFAPSSDSIFVSAIASTSKAAYAASPSDGIHLSDNASAPKRRRVVKPREVPQGAIVTSKSCKRCRERRVKCDRLPPVCKNCREREEECDLAFVAIRKRAEHPQSQKVDKFTHVTVPSGSLEKGQTASISSIFPDGSSLPAFVDPSTLDIGERSLDWRLATPAMADSLTQSLCDAFFESCCFILPTFTWYRGRLKGSLSATKLASFDQAALAAFCAVGARTSPHSALLGIGQSSPTEPLLLAGTRRQSACVNLINRAHRVSFEQGLEDEATIKNLASLLVLYQMASFVEIEPKRSRSLLRAAISHFKDLQDGAATELEKNELKRTFGYALYTADSQTSAYGKTRCLISDQDLREYFDYAGIVVPSLPHADLAPVLAKLLSPGSRPPMPVDDKALRSAVHLVGCWTAACQRMWVRDVAVGVKTAEKLSSILPTLWAAIDSTRSAIQYLQSLIVDRPLLQPMPHSHSHNADKHSLHETDFVAMVIRSDRDLCDLLAMEYTMLADLEGKGMLGVSALREKGEMYARKVLKTQAFYFKMYVSGADLHMVFHAFTQMSFNPRWTAMALQRMGEIGGPRDESEEVSELELGWFVEGLQHACYYTPSAEERLEELMPRLVEMSGITNDTYSFLDRSSTLSPLSKELYAEEDVFDSFTQSEFGQFSNAL